MYVEVFNGGGNERASKSDEGDSGSEFEEERDVIEDSEEERAISVDDGIENNDELLVNLIKNKQP